MIVNLRHLRSAIGSLGGWIMPNGTVVFKLTCFKNPVYYPDETHGPIVIKEIGPDFIIIPSLFYGYIELRFLRENQNRFIQYIKKYKLDEYLNDQYPVFRLADMPGELIRRGEDLSWKFLTMREEVECVDELYDNEKLLNEVIDKWLLFHPEIQLDKTEFDLIEYFSRRRNNERQNE